MEQYFSALAESETFSDALSLAYRMLPELRRVFSWQLNDPQEDGVVVEGTADVVFESGVREIARESGRLKFVIVDIGIIVDVFVQTIDPGDWTVMVWWCGGSTERWDRWSDFQRYDTWTVEEISGAEYLRELGDDISGDGCPVPGIIQVDGRRDYAPEEVRGDLDVVTYP